MYISNIALGIFIVRIHIEFQSVEKYTVCLEKSQGVRYLDTLII